MKKELRRSATDCKLCGVCGGLGEYFNLDSNLIRLLWAAFSLFAGSGIILYIIAAILMPKAEEPQSQVMSILAMIFVATRPNRCKHHWRSLLRKFKVQTQRSCWFKVQSLTD